MKLSSIVRFLFLTFVYFPEKEEMLSQMMKLKGRYKAWSETVFKATLEGDVDSQASFNAEGFTHIVIEISIMECRETHRETTIERRDSHERYRDRQSGNQARRSGVGDFHPAVRTSEHPKSGRVPGRRTQTEPG